jgi:hypothetical protein
VAPPLGIGGGFRSGGHCGCGHDASCLRLRSGGMVWFGGVVAPRRRRRSRHREPARCAKSPPAGLSEGPTEILV